MPKLTDFFIGILDFFAVLLPGAIASFVISSRFALSPGASLLEGMLVIPREAAGVWALFLVASYFLGHLIFMLGSMLDGPFHLWRAFYRSRESDRPGRLLETCRLQWVQAKSRVLRKKCVPEKDELHAAALAYRRAVTMSGVEPTGFNTFQWSRSLLMEKAQAAASDVHRLEADSKFFRGLAVLLVMLSIDIARQGRLGFAAFVFFVAALCIWQYGARRWKSEKQAYIHVLTLRDVGTLPSPKPDGTKADA